MDLQLFSDIFYIFSPIIGFIPQIYRCRIIFSPFLSVMAVISCIFKLFHYQIERYSTILLYQALTLIALHLYLINNYKLPLRHVEMKMFRPKWYLRYGLFNYSLCIFTCTIFFLHSLYMFDWGHLFGNFACLLDIFTTFLQMVIYKDSENKPQELFLLWVAGDCIKIYVMLAVYKTPIEYVAATGVQLLMNLYVVLI